MTHPVISTYRTTLALLPIPLLAAACLGLLALHRPAPSAPVVCGQVPAASRAPSAAAPSALTLRQARIVAGAKAQIGDIYDASYCTLAYPNGDPPAGRGACTDVVVRSLRANGVDLQMLVHADMTRHWDRYPHRWGLSRPDPNIDQRRVPNLAVFFRRHGETLPNAVTPQTLSAWQPGDIVCWRLPGGLDHTGIVSDTRNSQGVPLVIHNLSTCAEQDVLTAWPITGHYRYPN
jgi:uncharacterized protein YijF (DUF1287 family)